MSGRIPDSIDHSARAWEAERRGLSHQDLKNSFLLHAERLARSQRMHKADVTLEVTAFLRRSWSELGPRLQELAARFEPDCSPRLVLAEMLQACDLPQADRLEMLEALHEEWCSNLGVREWSRSASESIDGIRQVMQDRAIDGARLESACRRLCDLLHAHPTRKRPI